MPNRIEANATRRTENAFLSAHYDRVPENMLRVWRAPADYLPGPDSKLANKAEEHFVVVGGGAAGLTSAYILLKLGHRVRSWPSLIICNL